MKPIRVLLIAPSFDIVGGQAVQACRLIEALRDVPQIEIEFLPINPRAPKFLRRLQKVKYLRTLITSLLYTVRLLSSIRRYDVLHIFTPGYFAFLLAPAPAILLAKLLGKKTILNYRDGRAEDHLTKSSLAIRIMRQVDAILTPSGFLVDVFSKFGLEAHSIPNIVDTDRFHFRQENDRPRPIFLHNRGLEPLYNVQCTLRAFALIQQRYPDSRLIVAHDGSARKSLQDLAATLDLRNVSFVGSVSQQEMTQLYAKADIYIMSPEIDNMPGSVLECFAAGLPVIATRVGGVPYVVEHEHTGLLVDNNAHHAIAASAFRLLEETELAGNLRRNARRECLKYAPAAIIDQWTSLYASLTAGRSESLIGEAQSALS